MTHGGRRFMGKVVLVTSGSPGMGPDNGDRVRTQGHDGGGLSPNHRRRRAAQAAHGVPVVFSRSTWAQPNHP
jgi:hypothetical protein